MNKKIWIAGGVGGILLLAGLGWWLLRPPPDFRAVNWGMTPAQVQAQEAAPLQKAQTASLLYQTVLFEKYPAALEYQFQQGRLAGAKYFSLKKYQDFAACQRDFQSLRQQLLVQLGTPHDRDEADFQFAIWETPQMQVTLTVEKTGAFWSVEYQPPQTKVK